jgi:hypothetical protein
MRRSVKIIVVAVVLAAIAACYVASRNRRPASVPNVILLDPDYRIPPQKISLFNRVVPAARSWGWLWKLKEVIGGKRKSVEVDAAIMDLSGWSESWTNDLSLPQARFTGTNGLRIWFLESAQVTELRTRLKQNEHAESLSLGRIITGDEGQARLSSGSTLSVWDNQLQRARLVEAGLSMDMVPRVRPGLVDLTTLVRFSAAVTNQPSAASSDASSISIQTNLALAARIQIPDNAGVFIVDGITPERGTNRLGVILSARIWKPGK